MVTSLRKRVTVSPRVKNFMDKLRAFRLAPNVEKSLLNKVKRGEITPATVIRQLTQNQIKKRDEKKERAKKVRFAAVLNKNTKPKIKANPNPKEYALNRIAQLRKSETTNRGKAAAVMMSGVIRDHSKIKVQSMIKNDEQFKKLIKSVHNQVTQSTQLVEVGKKNIKLSGYDIHDLLLMFWLDMGHDKLLGAEYKNKFSNFIKGPHVKIILKSERTPPKVNQNSKLAIKLKSHGIIKFVGKNDIKPGGDIENKFKKHLHTIWNTENPIIIRKGDISKGIHNYAKNKSKPIYVSLDSEGSGNNLSTFMRATRHKPTGSKYFEYYLKRLITVANLLDPGRGAAVTEGGHGKAQGLINAISAKLLPNNKNRAPKAPFKFNYQEFSFKFADDFNINIINRGASFVCKLNDIDLNVGVKVADAIKSKDPRIHISKTFGDFLQILTNATLYNQGKNVVGATLDGMFVGMVGFIHEDVFKIKPRIIVDDTNTVGNAEGKGIIIHGLNDQFNFNVHSPNNSRAETFNGNGANGNSPPSVRKKTSPNNSRTETLNGNGANRNLPPPVRKKTAPKRKRSPQNNNNNDGSKYKRLTARDIKNIKMAREARRLGIFPS